LFPEGPEFPEAGGAVFEVNQIFNSQELEEFQQLNFASNKLEASFRIIVALMPLQEEVERPAVQMPSVSRILPGRRVSVVRGDNLHLSTVPGNSVELFHGSGDRIHVLNHMAQSDKVKSILRKRIRELIQVVDNVDSLQGDPIEPDASRELFCSTTDIQYFLAQVDNQQTMMNASGGQF
jgi:hypothetical protein